MQVQSFYTTINSDVKNLTMNGLAEMGIDLDVVARATELQMTLFDFDELQRITKKLNEVYENTSCHIYKEAEDYVQSKVNTYPR